jgi:uncharacterized delta-60 repeat protein
MMSRPLAHWLRTVRDSFAHRPRRADRRPAFRPVFEFLEDRTTPSGGALDPTFGTGGVATIPTATYTTVAITAVQPDGKILTVQTALLKTSVFSIAFTYQPTVTRLNPNGTVDTSFGTNGTVKLPVATDARPSALAVAPDGKILVGATAYTTYSHKSGSSDAEYAVARLTPNGTLDSSFGNNHGWWLYNPSTKDEVVDQLATVPAAGGGYSIIVGGTAGQADGSTAFVAAKLTQAGLPDPTFGTNGLAVRKVSTGLTTPTAIGATSMAVTASGEIVFSGHVGTSGSALNGWVLVGFTPAGQPDAGFGTGGVVTLYATDSGGVVTSTFPGTIDGITGAGVTAQGNSLIVVGSVLLNYIPGIGGVAEGYVIRYTPSGALDSTFGTGGVYTGPASLTTGNSRFFSVAVAADGSIVLAGGSTYKDANNVYHPGLIVGHLTAGGLADPGFGTDGTGLVIRRDIFPYPVPYYPSLNIDPNGNILVGGVDNGYPAHGYLMRFTIA